MKRKIIAMTLALTLLCGIGAVSTANEGRETVTIWHLWTGTQIDLMQQICDNFNASQDKYFAEQLSVPDEQKILVAIASGEGPDVTDSFSSSVSSYAAQGILTPLDDLIARDGYDLNAFVPTTLDICRADGVLYALPINMNLMMLYYNKDMFEAAGIQPPKTDEELLAAAVALTQKNEDGSLKTLGFPDFPWVYYLANFAYAFGANYTNEDNTEMTIDTEGFRRALEIMIEYREQFGVENVTRFMSGGAYLDATDPFLNGTQAMRVDGPWVPGTMKELDIEMNYGVIPIPYLAGHEDQAGRAIVSSSMFYIPSTAKNVDGGWEFTKYICGYEGAKIFVGSDLPANLELLNDAEYLAEKGFPEFVELAKSPNLTALPSFGRYNDYSKLINDESELAVNGKQSIDDAIDHITEYSAEMFE